MTIDIGTERLRELAFAHEAHAKKSEWDRDIATALRALIAARELVDTLRAKADRLAECWDGRERGEACGTRDAANTPRRHHREQAMSAPELLADRVEREEPSADLWMAAFEATQPRPPLHQWSDVEAWLELDQRMKLLIAHKAYRDAAAMLVPSGWLMDISEWPPTSYDTFEARLVRESDYDANANISETEVTSTVTRGPHAEARARLAAALRAHAADRDKGGDRE